MRLALMALAVGVSSCTTADGFGHSDASARADLRNAAGRVVAQAELRAEEGGLRVMLTASEVSPGIHGVHLHAVGRCDPPGFDSAGPHWNPTDGRHGHESPQGPHLGDLPNLAVESDGRGRLEFTIAGAALRGERGVLDADGAAVVIHAAADDHRTDPSGNSGARIACGVLA